MFEIYHRKKLVGKVEKFFFAKDNTLFQSLRGINIEGDGKDVYVDPIYMPFLTVKREGTILFIDIAKRDGNFLTIVLHPHFPFIYVGNGNVSMEDDE